MRRGDFSVNLNDAGTCFIHPASSFSDGIR